MDTPHEVLAIALSLTKYIGPRNAAHLLEELGSIEAVFAGKSELSARLPRLRKKIIDELYCPDLIPRAEKIWAWCRQVGVQVSSLGDPAYPSRLGECPDAPIVLYSRGNVELWESLSALSVVGTRNISPYGQKMVGRILGGIREMLPDTPIISGLAYGVDVAAHREALRLGLPTVAVLAHGLDRIYPSGHTQVAREIVEQGGCLVSEYPPRTTPERYNFIARNRIIAGLSDGSIIIEAGLKSGSLYTAELAAAYNRMVFAVPGRVDDKYSEGCNDLIARMKGVLTRSAEDIFRELGWKRRGMVLEQQLSLEIDMDESNPLLAIIKDKQPIHIDDLHLQSGMDMSSLNAELFDLELDGHILSLPGGLYTMAH